MQLFCNPWRWQSYSQMTSSWCFFQYSPRPSQLAVVKVTVVNMHGFTKSHTNLQYSLTGKEQMLSKALRYLLFPCKHQLLCNRAWDFTYSYLSPIWQPDDKASNLICPQLCIWRKGYQGRLTSNTIIFSRSKDIWPFLPKTDGGNSLHAT